jgi:hypothetical protein
MNEVPLPNVSRVIYLIEELLLWTLSVLLFSVVLKGVDVVVYSDQTLVFRMNIFHGIGLLLVWFALDCTWKSIASRGLIHKSIYNGYWEEKLADLARLVLEMISKLRNLCKIFLLVYVSLLLLKILLYGVPSVRPLLEAGINIDFSIVTEFQLVELI